MSSIQLSNGKFFDFLNPDPSVISIEVVADSLSKLCRYTGHCSEYYSVAQHSVLVSHLVEPQHELQALLHDAAEAFLGDVASPLKALLPDYKALEVRVNAAVMQAFGLPEEIHPYVKDADVAALYLEHKRLMVGGGIWDEGLFDSMMWPTIHLESIGSKLVFQPPAAARKLFLNRYKQLTH